MEEELAVEAPVEAVETSVVTSDAPTDAPIETPDALSPLEEALKAQFPDEPVADKAEVPELSPALSISEYVKTPEHIEQAVRAAAEVWDVANGKTEASSLLEGMRSANPQGFEKVVANLIPYLEQITGKTFGAAPEAPPDPRDAKLKAIEERFAREDRERQEAQYRTQAAAADSKVQELVRSKLAGTAFEGEEARLISGLASKLGIPIQESMKRVLSGNNSDIEKALKAVQAEDIAFVKRFNANLIKQHRTLSSAVPGQKQATKSGDAPAYKPGETTAQYASRLWNAGK